MIGFPILLSYIGLFRCQVARVPHIVEAQEGGSALVGVRTVESVCTSDATRVRGLIFSGAAVERSETSTASE